MPNYNGFGNNSRRANKRGKYCFGASARSRCRQKVKIFQPGCGFENESLQPSPRQSLHVDERFLPFGMCPGSILEIKGPAKSGKTFLLTYLMVRVLSVYPEKKVLFVDTRHKFNVKNFVSILGHFDRNLRDKLGASHEERQLKLSKPLPILFEEYPELKAYLDRIHVLSCFSAEDLMLAFSPPDESLVERLLIHDGNTCLVAIDAVDNFSFAETKMNSMGTPNDWNVMRNIRECTLTAKCPVVCTTLIPMENYVYQVKKTPSQTMTGVNGNKGLQSNNQQRSSGSQSSSQRGSVEQKYANNFKIDYSIFTHILTLKPVSEAEKGKLVHPYVKNITHCSEAYLRSRHNANTAGSGGNHCVRFSIFSDMLWVI